MSERSIAESGGRQARLRLLPALLTMILLGVLAAAACSGSGDNQAGGNGGTRTTEAGSVTVELSWDGPGSGLEFDVAMDTHSVDLDGFDLMTLARLRTDAGSEIAPSGWDAKKGGHHREGKLSFPESVDGRPVLSGVRIITVVVKDVASPERTFQWAW